MIEVYRDTKIYVVAPNGVVTGGPEMLHGLVHNLRKDLKVEAYIYYYPKTAKEVNKAYSDYDVVLADRIVDDYRNIIIVPELVDFINFSRSFKKIRKVIYWLSVDFFYQSIFYKRPIGLFMAIANRINMVSIEKLNKTFLPHFDISSEAIKFYSKLDLKNLDLFSDISFHLAQGVRILDFLRNCGFENVSLIGDYINKSFMESGYNVVDKQDLVCYNPKKGFEFTSKIIEYVKCNNLSIKFVPMIGMSRREVISLLKRSKLYIDFGSFPGADRIPREAVILGCCVITGKRGAARYFDDVPIPDEYKFEDKVESIPAIVSKIQECLSNYEKKEKDFDISRSIIREQPKKYVQRLKNIFIKL
ncbi:MAG: hypothetical protein N2712_03405 [Brevinematales bacterium]|nr:hypothetical protein [Brevinematales bacterium]